MQLREADLEYVHRVAAATVDAPKEQVAYNVGLQLSKIVTESAMVFGIESTVAMIDAIAHEVRNEPREIYDAVHDAYNMERDMLLGLREL